jgi:hypothetical protein
VEERSTGAVLAPEAEAVLEVGVLEVGVLEVEALVAAELAEVGNPFHFSNAASIRLSVSFLYSSKTFPVAGPLNPVWT